jgi:hypothetical protein
LRARSDSPGEPVSNTTGGAFGIGAGNRVHRVESADTIGDAERSDPVDPSVGVCCESGAVFTRGPDVFDGRCFDELVQRKDIIAGNAEDMPDPRR